MSVSNCRRYAVVERKSFDFVLEGEIEDIIRVTENAKGSRLSIFLYKEDFRWFMKGLDEFWSRKGESPWYRVRRSRGSVFVLRLHKNANGRMLSLMEVIGGGSRSVIFPEGVATRGWWLVYRKLKELEELTFGRSVIPRPTGGWTPVRQSMGGEGKSEKAIVGREKSWRDRVVEGRISSPGVKVDGSCPCCGYRLMGKLVFEGRGIDGGNGLQRREERGRGREVRDDGDSTRGDEGARGREKVGSCGMGQVEMMSLGLNFKTQRDGTRVEAERRKGMLDSEQKKGTVEGLEVLGQTQRPKGIWEPAFNNTEERILRSLGLSYNKPKPIVFWGVQVDWAKLKPGRIRVDKWTARPNPRDPFSRSQGPGSHFSLSKHTEPVRFGHRDSSATQIQTRAAARGSSGRVAMVGEGERTVRWFGILISTERSGSDEVSDGGGRTAEEVRDECETNPLVRTDDAAVSGTAEKAAQLDGGETMRFVDVCDTVDECYTVRNCLAEPMVESLCQNEVAAEGEGWENGSEFCEDDGRSEISGCMAVVPFVDASPVYSTNEAELEDVALLPNPDQEEEVCAHKASNWVLRKMREVNKIAGVSFSGVEKDAMKLFIEIERRRLEEGRAVGKKGSCSGKKSKEGSRELKKLEWSICYDKRDKGEGMVRGEEDEDLC